MGTVGQPNTHFFFKGLHSTIIQWKSCALEDDTSLDIHLEGFRSRSLDIDVRVGAEEQGLAYLGTCLESDLHGKTLCCVFCFCTQMICPDGYAFVFMLLVVILNRTGPTFLELPSSQLAE